MPRHRTRKGARLALALLLVVVLALAAATAFASPSQGARKSSVRQADQVVVKFAPKASSASIAKINKRTGAKELKQLDKLGVRVLKVPKGRSAKDVASAYKRDPNVVFAEPDHIMKIALTPNDPRYPDSWALPKIDAPGAWDVTTGSTSVLIAVVDTGVTATYPELAGRVTNGYDFVNEDSNPADDHGHGTACAGIIGATGNNGEGVAGIDWRARLLPVKVMDFDGYGATSDIAQGITYAVDRGAKVISLSLGSDAGSTTLRNAISYAHSKGVFVVGASGNDGNASVYYPAAYDGVMAVGATDRYDEKADFSNWGTALDVTAPGVSILTTRMQGGYVYFSGTSAATPFVAGLAGLAFAKNPGLTPAQVESAIKAGAQDLGPAGWDEQYGWGRIDAAKTLAAVPPPPPPDTMAPTVSIASPRSGDVLAGSGTVRVSAQDDRGIGRVELFIDGTRVGTDASAPYEFTWNTRNAGNAVHTLVAKAVDLAGNSGESEPIAIRVKNTKTVR